MIKDLINFNPEGVELTPIATASFFSEIYKDSVVYVPERKAFFVFNGEVWERDAENLLTHEKIKEFVLNLIEYYTGKGLEDEQKSKYYQAGLKYYNLYLNRKNRCSLLEDIKGNHTANMKDFDKSPVLFNCKNGTLNLATGKFYEHKASDFLTKQANVTYDSAARCERFEKFINEIMQGNKSLIEYLQKTLGYAISGMSTEECFFIWFGASTRNGKGTLNSTITYLLGDYSTTAQYETFESKKFGASSGASEDIARLSGARYVAVSEPSETMVLNSALIKTLTGNDTITARYLYEGSFEFVGHFKIIINTNHLPSVPDDSVFSSGRVKVIPFSRHFEEWEQDHSLKADLIKPESLSGILNWLIEGFNKYATENHLIEPEEVKAEVNKYRKDNDKIGEFVNDCIVVDAESKHHETLTRIYRVYTNWCKDNGYKAYNRKNFKVKLEKVLTVRKYNNQDHAMNVYIDKNVPEEWK